MNIRIVSLALLLGLVGQMAAKASIFTGPTTFDWSGVTFVGFSSIPVVIDVSGLSYTDTPDGSRISGVLRGTFTGANPNTFQVVSLQVHRNVSVPVGTELIASTQFDATISTSGSLNVYQIYSEASLWTGGNCPAGAGLSTGSGLIGMLGPVSAGPESQLCNHPTLPYTELRTNVGVAVYSPDGGNGSFTIDYGTSAYGAGRLADPVVVPEPSTLLVVAASFPLLLRLRRILVRP